MIAALHRPEIHPSAHDDGAEEEVLLQASLRLAQLHADLIGPTHPQEMVGRAMIGATIHFYDAMGQGHRLPAILRSIAGGIEQELLKPGRSFN